MAADPAALLTKVEAAIDARLDGGAVDFYSIDGRNLKYVSLTDLFAMRRKLAREVETLAAGGLPVAYAVKDKRLAES